MHVSDERKKRMGLSFADMLRKAVLAWVIAAAAEYLLLPGSARGLEGLDGIAQMSLPRMALTAAAGPISNLLMSIIFILLSNVAFIVYCNTNDSTVAKVTFLFFFYAAMINISLAVFNLIPIPPLDGSRIIGLFIPNKVYYQIMKYERYIIMVVFLLLAFGWLSTPLSWLTDKVLYGISWLVSKPFGEYGDMFMQIVLSAL